MIGYRSIKPLHFSFSSVAFLFLFSKTTYSLNFLNFKRSNLVPKRRANNSQMSKSIKRLDDLANVFQCVGFSGQKKKKKRKMSQNPTTRKVMYTYTASLQTAWMSVSLPSFNRAIICWRFLSIYT